MGEHHNHHHGSKNILLAFFLNVSFAIIELIGGYYTNSVAIISDAIHDFGDSLALLLSYFAEKISKKSADKKFTFGYRRFSILSALINGLILLVGSLYIFYEGIQRLLNPQEVKPEGMLVLAILGVVVNGYSAYRLSRGDSLNTKMVMYHLLEDLLGWVAVLIVSIILLFKPWYQLDSILSILIAFIILRGVYRNLMKVGMIFLQKFPDDLELASIKEQIINMDLVSDIHAIKGWSIDSNTYYLRFHIQVPSSTVIEDIDGLKVKIKQLLEKYNVKYSTIEFESDKCVH